jgi:hypothetical protein
MNRTCVFVHFGDDPISTYVLLLVTLAPFSQDSLASLYEELARLVLLRWAGSKPEFFVRPEVAVVVLAWRTPDRAYDG